MKTYAAVDLGPTGGRVATARISDDALELTEVLRFPNRPVRVAGTLHWNILGLYGRVLDGLRAAGPGIASAGISAWAADYGLLDGSGALLGNPVHHADERTHGVMERVRSELTDEHLYELTGGGSSPAATMYQLVAATRELHRAGSLLLIPDLLAYWLTGAAGAEITNASTTGLIDVRSRSWSAMLMDLLGLPERLLQPLLHPGDTIGTLLPEVADDTGLPQDLPVTAVASLGGASALAALPAADERFAYIVCDAVSRVGVELTEPVVTPAGCEAGFVNEAGVDATTRFERETAGLWPLHESLRSWGTPGLSGLLAEAADVPPLRSVVDLGAPQFRHPGDIPAQIMAYCKTTGQRTPAGRAETVRCIIDSLALAHRSAIRRAASLSGRDVRVVHVAGAGSRYEPLCQAIADACALPVIAGPAGAAALGNALVQAGSFGVAKELHEKRELSARTQVMRRYEPRLDRYRPGEKAWSRAGARIGV